MRSSAPEIRSAWIVGSTPVLAVLWITSSRSWLSHPRDAIPALSYALLAAIAALTLRWWMLRRAVAASSFDDIIVSPTGATSERERPWLWFAAALAVLIAALTVLEVEYPYYFVQDDNFIQFLPPMLHGCRLVWNGQLPQWNPYQLLGAPLAEVGYYALTYPPTYLSYAIARAIGREAALIDVFCWIHLISALASCFWMARKIRLSAPLAATFALSIALSGFSLIGGRSTYAFLPVFTWTPLLIGLTLKLEDAPPRWRDMLFTGLIIGLGYHASHAQLWFYGLIATLLLALHLVLTGRLRFRNAVAALPGWLLGIGIASVLLVPQLLATRDLMRSTWADGIDHGVAALFLPFPFVIAPLPYTLSGSQGDWPVFLGHFYYTGSLLPLAWLGAFVYALLRRASAARWWMNPWLAVSLVIFLSSLGHRGLLWDLQHYLPLLRKFRASWKFLPILHLFSLAAGAIFLDRLFALLNAKRAIQARSWCFAITAALLLAHSQLCNESFQTFVSAPYPALPPKLRAFLPDSGPARIFPLYGDPYTGPGATTGLGFLYPTIYRIQSLPGDDPFVMENFPYYGVQVGLLVQPIETLRRYGVSYITQHASAIPSDKDFLPIIAYAARQKPVFQTYEMRIVAVDHADPLAFLPSDPATPLPISVHPDRVDVDLAHFAGGDVTINFLYREHSRVRADGALLPVHADLWDRITVNAPAGTQRLTLTYESPWGLGLLFAAGTSAVALALQLVFRRRKF